jgi:anti-sigma factor RsiW
MSECRTQPPSDECLACAPLLATYVDGEAPACDCTRLEQHIESCACCRDGLAYERAAREAVRARREGLRACAPATLKARCAAHAARRAAGPVRAFPASPASLVRPGVIRRWVPVSIAASLVLAVAVVFSFGLNNKVQALAIQSTVDHVKCVRFNTPAGAADPVTAAQRWQARFGWPLRIPTSAAKAGLELRAVRRCAVTDGRVAHLIYSWMGEPLSVYVLPKRTLGDAAQFVQRFHHQSVMWSQNDRTYIIVTPRPHDAALDRVIEYVRTAAY